MDFKLKEKIYLSGMNAGTRQAIKNLLTIENPKFLEARKMGRYAGNIKCKLKFYEETPDCLICPRGAATQIYMLCQNHREIINMFDERRILSPVEFNFHGSLRPLQVSTVESCFKRDFGLLEAGTGAGKTCMALYMIAQRKQPALVVVHTKELLNQWINRIEEFLEIPKDEIGIIGSGKFKIGEKVTVAMIQTLIKKVDQVSPHIGYLVLDECHRAPAMQYAKVIECFDCKYMTGLTATPYRRDDLTDVIFWHVGPVTGRIDKEDLLRHGDLCHAEVYWVKTEFNTLTDVSEFYSKALAEMTGDVKRNRLIAGTVAKNNSTGISLILSDRKEHCEFLKRILSQTYDTWAEVLTGATSKTERARIIDALHSGECKHLIATGQLIGEGFDLPEISTMFLTTPVKFHGRLIQYIGRALRPAPGKNRARIFDFVDISNPVFTASAKSRFYTYQKEGLLT